LRIGAAAGRQPEKIMSDLNIAAVPASIYQIFYSEETRRALDPGFIPLDNTGLRPDWREYWPIRHFLLQNTLEEGRLYGFFSPKFRQKTSLDAAAVNSFLAGLPVVPDVVSFSPFYDQTAYFLNTFEQAATNHPGSAPIWQAAVALLMPGVNTQTLVMDWRHAIFCNYFLARPAFWRRWLELCEKIFALCEQGSGELHDRLNGNVDYDNGLAPAKVFMIERMVSLLLAVEPGWQSAGYNPLALPSSGAPIGRAGGDMLILDALKRSARDTGRQEYLQVFMALRNNMAQNAAR
jgi:hypothetical protein